MAVKRTFIGGGLFTGKIHGADAAHLSGILSAARGGDYRRLLITPSGDCRLARLAVAAGWPGSTIELADTGLITAGVGEAVTSYAMDTVFEATAIALQKLRIDMLRQSGTAADVAMIRTLQRVDPLIAAGVLADTARDLAGAVFTNRTIDVAVSEASEGTLVVVDYSSHPDQDPAETVDRYRDHPALVLALGSTSRLGSACYARAGGAPQGMPAASTAAAFRAGKGQPLVAIVANRPDELTDLVARCVHVGVRLATPARPDWPPAPRTLQITEDSQIGVAPFGYNDLSWILNVYGHGPRMTGSVHGGAGILIDGWLIAGGGYYRRAYSSQDDGVTIELISGVAVPNDHSRLGRLATRLFTGRAALGAAVGRANSHRFKRICTTEFSHHQYPKASRGIFEITKSEPSTTGGFGWRVRQEAPISDETPAEALVWWLADEARYIKARQPRRSRRRPARSQR